MSYRVERLREVQYRDIHLHSAVPPVQEVLQSGEELGLAGMGSAKTVL